MNNNIKTFEEYKKTYEYVEEGKWKTNQKEEYFVCIDCGYKGPKSNFKKLFSKTIKCPKCKSENYKTPERPNVIPAPQRIRREQ